MTLARPHLTSASRIMLPTYPILAGVSGVNYIVTPDSALLATPTLRTAASIMPLTWWGCAFLATSLVMTFALILGRRWTYTAALALLGSMLLVWTAVNAMASLMGQASPGAWVWPGFALVSCCATARSLNRRETDDA